MKKAIAFTILMVLLPITEKTVFGLIHINSEEDNTYTELKLAATGLSEEACRYAFCGFKRLRNEGKLANDSVLTIIDFSQSSNNKRMYVLNLNKKSLLFNTYVAHGRNTGNEYAEKFSNIPGTYQSSLGFFLTENIAVGSKVGLSLVLNGLEKGINDRAREREIIIHGASYATADFIRHNGRLGRSYGCPALPPDLVKPVVETIKNGSLLFIYHPDNDYLQRSPVLN